jgi:AraC-like DNA-binding protein
MSSLEKITDWEERGRSAGYSVSRLAKACSVTERTLLRYFLIAFEDTPHEWLNKLRQRDATAALNDRKSVKETAAIVNYTRASSLSRSYKKFYRIPPSLSQ